MIQLQYFKIADFGCRCNRGNLCDAVAMDEATMALADALRHELGEAIYLNSGVRCHYWNKAVGGAADSQHLLGKAIDIRAATGQYAMRVLMAGIKVGFTGFGVKPGLIHADTRIGPQIVFGYAH